jgi:hypothetical protein
MSHTTRRYNNPNNSCFVHPYNQVCMGNCNSCKSANYKKDSKHIRAVEKQEFIKVLDNEMSILVQ